MLPLTGVEVDCGKNCGKNCGITKPETTPMVALRIIFGVFL
jgi:hypothetical protein